MDTTDGTTPPGHSNSPTNPTSPSNTASPATLTNPASPASLGTPASPTSNIVRLNLAGLSGTGDSRVDEAVAQLGRLDDAPLGEHPAILSQVHDRLREVLGELSPGETQPTAGTP
jgi:hypothetical protein